MESISKLSRVVIVGGGFGGLTAARALRKAPAQIKLIDQTNHHVFQPLLYQVATGTLSAGDIASPIRAILGGQKNVEVILNKTVGVDPKAREVILCDGTRVSYDYLILATGARHSYFAHPEWEKDAPGLKSLSDAEAIREKVIGTLELAEGEQDPEKKRSLMTFVVVGGGPTGVELSGALAEISTHVLRTDFRHIDPKSASFLLVEAGPRILATFSEQGALHARRKLESFGVSVRTGAPVDGVDEEGGTIGGERIASKNVVWAAGVAASPAAKWLGVPSDKSGRTLVRPDLSVPDYPEVFVIGDAMKLEQGGKPLPGLAPVALQQGRYVARVISGRIRGKKPLPPFHYLDKGNVATIGRTFALAEWNHGKIHVSGSFAKLIWAAVHIFFLVGLRARVAVIVQWFWALVAFQGNGRLITSDRVGECASEDKKTKRAA